MAWWEKAGFWNHTEFNQDPSFCCEWLRDLVEFTQSPEVSHSSPVTQSHHLFNEGEQMHSIYLPVAGTDKGQDFYDDDCSADDAFALSCV